MQFVRTPMRHRRVAKLQTRNLISVKQSIFAPCSKLCAIAILLKNSLQFAFGIFTGTETDGYGYDRPRLRMGTDMKSTDTDGDGYNSHTRAALYSSLQEVYGRSNTAQSSTPQMVVCSTAATVARSL